MKQTILTIFFAIIALGASAQSPISFQVKAGVGTSNFYGENVESDTRIAYKVGVGMNYELNRTWVFQPSLNFVSIGAREEVEYVGKVNMNELYIQLPIMMAARLNLGKNYSASLSAGPYIAYGVGGKTSGSIPYYHDTGSSDGNRLFKIDTFGNILENNAGNRRLDGGIIVGIAFEYRRLIIGAEAQVGLVKINQQLRQVIDTEEFHNSLPRNFASFFTVGYKFR